MSASKIIASSRNRYRASAAERRMYGGSTVTEFFVHRAEDRNDPSKWKIVNGYGPTPGDRKTDAIRRSGFLSEPEASRDRHRRRATRRDEAKRPEDVTAVAREVFDHSDKARLLRAVERLGWSFVREIPNSGAWWIRKGSHEVMIVFGGATGRASVLVATCWGPGHADLELRRPSRSKRNAIHDQHPKNRCPRNS